MVLKSPMGVWGKKTTLTGKNKPTTTCSHPNLLEKKEEELILRITETVHEPIILEHSGDDVKVSVRIVTNPSAEATIIEKISGGVIHEVTAGLAENSEVAYAVIQTGTYASSKRAVLEQDARITWFELNTGTAYSRTTTELQEGARVRSNSIFLGKPGDHIDYGSKAVHAAPYSESQLFTKGVLRSAAAIYDGVLEIRSTAPHSNAHQKEDCLLLDEGADIKAAPQLFIDNNNVKCSHACSTTKPDEALAFYLQSRGVSKDVTESMLIKAFVWPVVETLPQHLACWVEKHVEETLTTYNG